MSRRPTSEWRRCTRVAKISSLLKFCWKICRKKSRVCISSSEGSRRPWTAPSRRATRVPKTATAPRESRRRRQGQSLPARPRASSGWFLLTWPTANLCPTRKTTTKRSQTPSTSTRTKTAAAARSTTSLRRSCVAPFPEPTARDELLQFINIIMPPLSQLYQQSSCPSRCCFFWQLSYFRQGKQHAPSSPSAQHSRALSAPHDHQLAKRNDCPPI